MDVVTVIALVSRWAHVLGAIALVGGLLFLRQVLAPSSAEQIDPAVNRRWQTVVRVSALFLLLSGFYNYWNVVRLDPGPRYHALFGIKFLLALVVLFLASVLGGRARAFEGMRRNLAWWLHVTVILAVTVVLIAGVLRVAG